MDRAKTSTLTGAEIVVRCLQEEGVEYVFGYPGGAVLNIYDALFKQTKVKHVLVRHEQGAVHAADGYSRSSQKVGVALVTSGPGVTNAVTGIATAYMDSIPLVIITGQVPTAAIGQDAFQECDTVGITRPCVKHNFLVKNVADLATTVKKAFYLASTGRPGPVVVDVPKDVTQASAEFAYPKTVSMRSYNPVTRGHAGQIKKAVQLLLEAKRPMVYTGGSLKGFDATYGYVTRAIRLLRAQTGDPDVPIHVAGGVADRMGAEELAGFVAAVSDDGSVLGVSLYDWQTTRPAAWRALAPLSR